MDDFERRNLALFRFSIIGPLVAGVDSETNLEAKYRELAKQVYVSPDGKRVSFTPGTIKKWHLKYRKAEKEQFGSGLQVLTPKNRIDCGSSRALSEKQLEHIREIKQEHPKISGQEIWNKMVEDGRKCLSESIDLKANTMDYLYNTNERVHMMNGEIKVQEKGEVMY